VNPLDPPSIAAAIERLIASPDEARRMGMCGRAAVERQFNWALEENALLSFYRSLLPDRSTLQIKPAMA
jgi:glycosyltransferase involved in cell wall biosynthesis